MAFRHHHLCITYKVLKVVSLCALHVIDYIRHVWGLPCSKAQEMNKQTWRKIANSMIHTKLSNFHSDFNFHINWNTWHIKITCNISAIIHLFFHWYVMMHINKLACFWNRSTSRMTVNSFRKSQAPERSYRNLKLDFALPFQHLATHILSLDHPSLRLDFIYILLATKISIFLILFSCGLSWHGSVAPSRFRWEPHSFTISKHACMYSTQKMWQRHSSLLWRGWAMFYSQGTSTTKMQSLSKHQCY